MEWGTTYSGLLVPERIARKPKAIDLFCGAGGFSLGFIQAGWEIVGAVECEPYAAITYMCNLGSNPIKIHFISSRDEKRLREAMIQELKRSYDKEKNIFTKPVWSGEGWIKHHPEASPVRHFWFGDIRELKGQDILNALGLKPGDIDCVIGGPPCQGFSRAGKQNIMDPRNSLVYEFARMVIEIQPKTFVMENVPEILKMMDPDGVPVIDKFCLMLQEGGYGKWEMLKKALVMQANYGVAIRNPCKEKRKRKAEQSKTEQLSMFNKVDDLIGGGL